MTLESPQVRVSKTQENIFSFISNIENFESLMPENISKFEVLGDDKFLFALKGMPEIILKKKEEVPPNKIVFGAAGGKIDFFLTANIIKVDEENSDIKLEFSGDFNPMMSMMVKGPISKFIETLATNLPKAV